MHSPATGPRGGGGAQHSSCSSCIDVAEREHVSTGASSTIPEAVERPAGSFKVLFGRRGADLLLLVDVVLQMVVMCLTAAQCSSLSS